MKFKIYRASKFKGTSYHSTIFKIEDEASFSVEHWWVEMNTLEELLIFSKKHGELLLNTKLDTPEITIYEERR